MTRATVCLASVALLSACSEKDLVIESNTSWRGSVDRVGELSGKGSARYTIKDTQGQICWVFTKTTTAGVLRVYAEDKTWFGLGTEVDSDDTTFEPNGQVRGCAR
jgi:hypothetical protein